MKYIFYQLLPRLFGNDNDKCVKNGSIQQNACGKMNDITHKTLAEIMKLGVTHIWYTGLLEHATQTDYMRYGIYREHPALVKGKAGSPYAVKDYYDIDPDLASQPNRRMREFEDLVKRTHNASLKVIMDFIPNHVAREYKSDNTPKEHVPLGENDNPELNFSTQNNFYYIQEPLQCQFDMQGDELLPYEEYPAKVTGNNCFSAHPQRSDWYETVKLNYGIDYSSGGAQYFSPTPNTWNQMRDILLFWIDKGVDAFRCDMAEMVPCAFWSWVIPQAKERNKDVLFIAEVYNPGLYRQYIHEGHFDYLYDKVGLYDTLRRITRGESPASSITQCWQQLDDIHEHMLHFLENHDEQRIASDFYASDGDRARAALIVSSCMNTQPFMVYSGQEFGEKGMDEEGFSGRDGRTTIYDYWSVKTIREWRNHGKYDGKLLSPASLSLYTFYKKILRVASAENAITKGAFFDLMYVNMDNADFNPCKTYAFLRSYGGEQILIAVNFDNKETCQGIVVPQHAFDCLGWVPGSYTAQELVSDTQFPLALLPEQKIFVSIPACSGIILKWNSCNESRRA